MPNQPGLLDAVDGLAKQLWRAIGSAWRLAIAKIVEAWKALFRGRQLTPLAAKQVVIATLRQWPDAVALAADAPLDRIYAAGFLYGVVDTGVTVGPDQGDANTLEWLKTNPNGFIPALRNMASDGVRQFEGIITDAYRGYDEAGERAPFDLNDMVARARERAAVGTTRARLILRTETAKATAYGRIMAWGDDPEKAWYDYHWIAHHDDRTKDISLKFEQEGPYEYTAIKKLWEVDHNTPQLVKNRHTGKLEKQTSAFNCRCSPARTPKTAQKLYSEGKITYAEMVADEAGGGQIEWRPVAA